MICAHSTVIYVICLLAKESVAMSVSHCIARRAEANSEEPKQPSIGKGAGANPEKPKQLSYALRLPTLVTMPILRPPPFSPLALLPIVRPRSCRLPAALGVDHLLAASSHALASTQASPAISHCRICFFIDIERGRTRRWWGDSRILSRPLPDARRARKRARLARRRPHPLPARRRQASV